MCIRDSLESSKSSLATLEKEMKDSIIFSPVNGYLENLNADIGENISNTSSIATIIGMSKIKLIVKVSQSVIGQIKIGDEASILIADGGEHIGKVSKISSMANNETRTFDVEISIENPKLKIKAGMTSEVKITTDTKLAFGISPAHLSVDSDGGLFAKIIYANKVKNEPVEVIKSIEDKVFISGLENGTILLTNGQAFVKENDEINFKLEK